MQGSVELSELLDSKHVTLVSICVVLSLHLVFKLIEFLWKLREKKDLASETAITKLTETLDKTNFRLEKLESSLDGQVKLRRDVRRSFQAVKILSGDQWPTIMNKIVEEERIIRASDS